MSGVEILGLVTSVIAVADTGLKLSIKLYTFTRKLKQADKKIDALADEIATTGAALQQLGEILSAKRSAQLYNPQAVPAAKKLIDDCQAVFQRLEKIIGGNGDAGKEGMGGKIGVKQRFLMFFHEAEVEEIQANVERLKSLLFVILHTLGLAELARSQETLSIVKEQQIKDQWSLLQTLRQESAANQKRYDELCRLIKDKGESQATKVDSSVLTLTVAPSGESLFRDVLTNTEPLGVPEQSALPYGMRHHASKIIHHGSLVTALLKEVASQRYKVDHAHRTGLHNGILGIHWDTWYPMRKAYGHEVFLKLFSNFEDVSGHWIDQTERAPRPRSVSRHYHHHYSSSSSSSSRSRSRERGSKKISMEDLPYELRRDLEKLKEQKSAPAPLPPPPPQESGEYKEWKRERAWERGREYERAKEKENELERQRKEEKARSKFEKMELELERARKEKARELTEERERWELEREREERTKAREVKAARDKLQLEQEREKIEKESWIREREAAMLEKELADTKRELENVKRLFVEEVRKSLRERRERKGEVTAALDPGEMEPRYEQVAPKDPERERERREKTREAKEATEKWQLELEREEREERERARKAKEEKELWKLEQEAADQDAERKLEVYKRRLEEDVRRPFVEEVNENQREEQERGEEELVRIGRESLNTDHSRDQLYIIRRRSGSESELNSTKEEWTRKDPVVVERIPTPVVVANESEDIQPVIEDPLAWTAPDSWAVRGTIPENEHQEEKTDGYNEIERLLSEFSTLSPEEIKALNNDVSTNAISDEMK